MKLWNAINMVFYFSFLMVSVYYITIVNWVDIDVIKVIEQCGVIGGLMFLGEFFRKEMDEKRSGEKNE